MPNLSEMIPDVDTLLRLAPVELAQYILSIAKQNLQNGLVHIGSITSGWRGQNGGAPGGLAYPQNLMQQVEFAIGEGWQWLEVNGMIMPDPGANGSNGHMRITRKGEAVLADPKKLSSYLASADFPVALLHPSFAQEVWLDLARGDYPTAILKAFRRVEETVRELGGYSDGDTGMPLMRLAFGKTGGPLTDLSRPEGEREALMHFFAGSLGSYKNPHSHRTISRIEPREAQQQVVIASHMMTILDAVRERLAHRPTEPVVVYSSESPEEE